MLLVFAEVEAKRVGTSCGWLRDDVAAILCEVATGFAEYSRLVNKGLACLSIDFDARLS
jgi:hypothetical protein